MEAEPQPCLLERRPGASPPKAMLSFRARPSGRRCDRSGDRPRLAAARPAAGGLCGHSWAVNRNGYLLSIICFDTAENKPSKISQFFINLARCRKDAVPSRKLIFFFRRGRRAPPLGALPLRGAPDLPRAGARVAAGSRGLCWV